MDFTMLSQLTQLFGPSGSEELVAKFISTQVRPYCDELTTDTLGNLIVRRHGTGKRILIAAHMDEIGLMITHIDKKGFLRFAPLGGVHITNLIGQRVKFNNGRIGTIGVEKLEKPTDLKLEKLFLDIGASTQEEAEQLVQIGETVTFIGDFVESGSRIISKALDDRIGCFVAIEALKRTKSTHELAFVFTVQEEVGTRGAQTAAFALEPDLAIAVDVTLTGDTPKAHTMSVELGNGVGIKVLDRSMVTSPQIKRWMAAVATDKNIPFQWEILEFGGTDSGAIHLSRGGVPSGVLSIPTRYVHSPAEMLDKRDVEAAVDLLVALLESLEPQLALTQTPLLLPFA
ncbi:M42 family metallopeptidase [Desulfosporosinus sp. Sb-LF]|uniref:M42 family metallopeptidase n=1 Tax=Desulfosporosinus sp. Sb-LF TaxID=2560027 RepID=UPI00107F7D04|nr:M42 family metallopeptidase [Desulfosporosinus sp. Sb-LF]TGE33512.1 M42 family peptidase [Desulfosporosinus sp. Sb-LF]